MLRAGEAFLAIAPLLAAALLYGVVFRRLPGRPVILLLTAVELVVAAAVIWQGVSTGLAPHERYVPAVMQGDTVVRGHGAP